MIVPSKSEEIFTDYMPLPVVRYRCISTYSRNYWLPHYSPRFWVRNISGSPGIFNDTAHWATSSGGASGASVPISTDDITFDGNGISGCIFDIAISVASITATSAYSGGGANDGHIDNATNDQAVTVADDVILDNDEVSMGDATWTVSGDWDHASVTTFNDDASTLVLDGAGKTITGNGGASARTLFNVTISGTYTMLNGNRTNGLLIVSGTLTANSNWNINGGTDGDVQVTSTGLITGSGALTITGTTSPGFDGAKISQQDGTINVATLKLRRSFTSASLVPAQYDSAEVIFEKHDSAGQAGELRFESGSYIFTGNVTFSDAGATGTYTVDNSFNNPNIEYRGNVTIDEGGGGTVDWIKGTGIITATGTALQTFTLLGKEIEKFTQTNFSTGGVTFADKLFTSLLTLDTTGGNTLTKFDETAAHVIDKFARIGPNTVVFRSEVDGVQWTVITIGNQSVQRFDVKDSNMSGGTYSVAAGTDSGNNSSNWVFVDVGIRVFIDGVDQTGKIMLGSLSWTDRLEGRGPMSMTLISKGPPPYFRPIVGQPVIVNNFSIRVWSGSIDKISEREPVIDVNIFSKCRCVDFNQIMDRFVVVKIYENQTCGDIIKDAITRFVNFEGESVTTNNVQDGPLIERAVFGYRKMSDVLRELSTISGFSWFIDEAKDLHFEDRATVVAPFSIFVGSKNFRKPDIDRSRTRLITRQIIRGGRDISDALQEDFAGDTERQTFTVAIDIAERPTITLNAASQTVGERGVDEGSDFQWFWRKGDKEISQRSSDTALIGTDVLSVSFKGFIPIVQISEDPAKILNRATIEGGSGIYENVFDDDSIEKREFAIQVADGRIRRFGDVPTMFRYETDVNGLRSGQLQSINLPNRGADMVGSFLIEEVSAKAIRAFSTTSGLPFVVIRYQIKLLSGEYLGSWINFFRILQSQGRSFKIDEDEKINIVRSFTEGIDLAEAFNTVDALLPFEDDLSTCFQWGSGVENRAFWGTLRDGLGFQKTNGSQFCNPAVDS